VAVEEDDDDEDEDDEDEEADDAVVNLCCNPSFSNATVSS